MKQPTNLLEAIRLYADLDVATKTVADKRWPNGAICPHCGSSENAYLAKQRRWKCRGCRKQFSVKVGTIFEDSPLGFDKWLPAVWLAANSKNGISSHELARALGITQKSAWFMLHRIREAMRIGSFMLSGTVEIDETYVGGITKNMHAGEKARKMKGQRGPWANKTPVLGMIERGGRVHAEVVASVGGKTLKPIIKSRVEKGSSVYTDAHPSYNGLDWHYDHQTIDHMVAYVEGQVHTNVIENFWSLLKRGLHGTYVSVDPDHLSRYVDERVFTFNNRKLTDYGRFSAVLKSAVGRRLTWLELTA